MGVLVLKQKFNKRPSDVGGLFVFGEDLELKRGARIGTSNSAFCVPMSTQKKRKGRMGGGGWGGERRRVTREGGGLIGCPRRVRSSCLFYYLEEKVNTQNLKKKDLSVAAQKGQGKEAQF